MHEQRRKEFVVWKQALQHVVRQKSASQKWALPGVTFGVFRCNPRGLKTIDARIIFADFFDRVFY